MRLSRLVHRLFGRGVLGAGRYALTSFNLRVSLPRTLASTVGLLAGRRVPSAGERPTLVTFSLFEDHVRLWLHFARRALGDDDWSFVVVDCGGTMDPARLPGATVVRLFNLSHGAKIDLLLRRLDSEVVFVLDDDQLLADGEVVSRALDLLRRPDHAAVSLVPRNWWKLRIGDREHFPMGSHAVLLRRAVVLEHGLSFVTRDEVCDCRVDAPGVRRRSSYDTGDHANQRLLELGYEVPTFEPVGSPAGFPRPAEEHHRGIVGFDGATAVRLMATAVDAAEILAFFDRHADLRRDSLHRYLVKSALSGLAIERLYAAVFAEPPRSRLPFAADEVLRLVGEANAADEDKDAVRRYWERSVEASERLAVSAGAD